MMDSKEKKASDIIALEEALLNVQLAYIEMDQPLAKMGREKITPED